MRIVKLGQRSTMRIFCSKCNAELEIDAVDLKKEPDDDNGLGSYYYTCLCCHSTQYLRPNEVTPQIRDEFRIFNRYK